VHSVYRDNYLDLDPTYRDATGLPLLRMSFDFRDNERRMVAFLMDKCREIAKSIGPYKLGSTFDIGRYGVVPYPSTHNTEGAVMGAYSATRVVNRYLQSWDVPNVFVVGAGVARWDKRWGYAGIGSR
jgi:gluconate 2-dehydrogenase alpha chain